MTPKWPPRITVGRPTIPDACGIYYFPDEKYVGPANYLSLAEHEHIISELKRKLESIRALVDKQAEDPGLWCIAERISEAHLQQELRKLHELIEGVSQEECARKAIEELRK